MSQQVEKLLKYQETDEKLLKIERETANSVERKNFLQAKSYLESAPQKFENLDAKACEMAELLQKLENKYKEIVETLGDFDHLDELVEGGADVSFYKKNVTQLTDQLKNIKSEINSLSKSIKELDEDYKTRKKKYIDVNKQAIDFQTAYKNFKTGKQEEAAKVQKQLVAIAKDIDPAIMSKYKEKRSERIFPILCTVNNGRCSKCGTELSLAGKEKISSQNFTECEYCHRILYNDKN